MFKNIRRMLKVFVFIFCVMGTYFWYQKSPVRQVSLVTSDTIGREVTTVYGSFMVYEPVLLDLFDCPEMHRIKKIYQYGPTHFLRDYNNPKKIYTRYAHSVGVWALLRRFGAGLEEQIAGLLHDVSHTVFSHVGDYVFGDHLSKDSYQDDIHEWYLKQGSVPEILRKHGMSLASIMHKSGDHIMLEQDLPTICADRLEYNLKAGLMEDLINESDIEPILQDITFENGRWYFKTISIAKKFCAIPLYNTVREWGGPSVFISQTWMADALKHAMKIGLVTRDEMHFSTDDVVWDRLCKSDDSVVKKLMRKIHKHKELYKLTTVNLSDHVVRTKFRGIDPWIKQGIKQAGVFKRLTELDADFAKEYHRIKDKTRIGWPVKFIGEAAEDSNYFRAIGS